MKARIRDLEKEAEETRIAFKKLEASLDFMKEESRRSLEEAARKLEVMTNDRDELVIEIEELKKEVSLYQEAPHKQKTEPIPVPKVSKPVENPKAEPLRPEIKRPTTDLYEESAPKKPQQTADNSSYKDFGSILNSARGSNPNTNVANINNVIPANKQNITKAPSQGLRDPVVEREIIKAFEEEAQTVRPDKIYYILSSRWWKQWKEYVSFDYLSEGKPLPTAMDNFSIIEKDDPPGQERLKKSCMENYDFLVVGQETWENLQEW